MTKSNFWLISPLQLQCKSSHGWPRIVYGSIKKKSLILVLPKGTHMQKIKVEIKKNCLSLLLRSRPSRSLSEFFEAALSPERICKLDTKWSNPRVVRFPGPVPGDFFWSQAGNKSLIHIWFACGMTATDRGIRLCQKDTSDKKSNVTRDRLRNC